MNDCTVHVGLDAHKKEHKAAVFVGDAREPVEMTVANDPAKIDRWVQRMQRKFPSQPIEVAYEAGVCGFALQRRIERPGVCCRVIAPSLIPIRPGQRVATDRRDAANLGRDLRSGLLTEVAWHQRHGGRTSKALRARRQGQPAWAVAIAEKAQERLHRRFMRLWARGLPASKVAMAVARESVGFIWALLQGPPPKKGAANGAASCLSPHAEAVPAARPPASGPPDRGGRRRAGPGERR